MFFDFDSYFFLDQFQTLHLVQIIKDYKENAFSSMYTCYDLPKYKLFANFYIYLVILVELLLL